MRYRDRFWKDFFKWLKQTHTMDDDFFHSLPLSAQYGLIKEFIHDPEFKEEQIKVTIRIIHERYMRNE
jgi:hypothetical protein